jgi:hypothetical protein
MKIIKDLYLFLLITIVAVLMFYSPVISAEKSSGLVAPGAVIKTVQSGFQGTEGPATDADGNVYFSDMMQQRIYKWTWNDGKVAVYRENTGMGNGTMFDAQGNLIVCEMANGKVTRDDMKGNITMIADSCNGKKLANPNDGWVHPKGGIYVSVFSMGGGPGAGRGGGPSGPPDRVPLAEQRADSLQAVAPRMQGCLPARPRELPLAELKPEAYRQENQKARLQVFWASFISRLMAAR